MKKVFRLFTLSVLSIFVLSIFSCNNFMDNKVKDEILNEIYIANHEKPVATLDSPTLVDSGVPKNRAIIIKFSIPVDPQTFTDNYEIADSAGNSLKEKFMQPQWSNNNTMVTIVANELNLIDLQDQKTMDVYVTLSNKCTTTDMLPLTGIREFRYKINNQIDNTPPEFVEVKASLPASYVGRTAKEGEEPAVFVEGALTDTSEESICKTNHINTKVDLYIEGNDYGGGEIWARILYKQVYDSVGNTILGAEQQYIFKLENKKEGSDNYYGSWCLDLSSRDYADGMYEAKIYIRDAYGDDSETCKVYNIIRDTRLAYSANARVGYYTGSFRDDVTPGYDISQNRELMDAYNPWNRVVPTVERIEDALTEFTFDCIPQDAYYYSKTSGKTYADSASDFTYYLSWGLDLDNLSEMSQFNEGIQKSDNQIAFPVLKAFDEFRDSHEDKDIYLIAAYRDSVGNENDLFVLYPKKVNFFNYVVSDDEENAGKKKITLNFEDMSSTDFTRYAFIPEREAIARYRVFYGKQEAGKDERTMALKRNTAVAWELDPWSGISDSHVIRNLDPGAKYYVYLQSNYETNSLVNGQWNGGFFGTLKKVIVDTALTGETNVQKPEFEILGKKSAGVNTALFNVTVKIKNPQENVKYMPCYSTDDGETWVSFSAYDSSEFTFAVTNPLRAPFGADEEWGTKTDNHIDDWDENTVNHEDNTYFKAVAICRSKYGYPDVSAKIKVLALSNNITVESEPDEIWFSENDDNIPPTVTKDVTQHDSKLSHDGHFYQYENIVREDEGHLSEFFQYYYTPYQEAWGDNLTILTPQEIEALPGGVTTYSSTCYKIHAGAGAGYNIDLKIPIFGLQDGHYMFFGKVTDTYGNYSYITLGKVHIGSFKEELKVEYDSEKKHLIATLPIQPDEYFERNMINIQHIWYGHNKYTMDWETKNYELYGYLNELQNCERTQKEGQTVLRFETLTETSNEIIGIKWNDDDSKEVKPKTPGASADEFNLSYNTIDPYQFYKITMQGFNENPYDKATGKGVDKKYGRPYSQYDPNATTDKEIDRYLYTQRIEGWVDNETEYDLCTEETVSNTVYFYVPPTRNDDPGWYENEIKSSFIVSTATPKSNRDYLVNVIASGVDLGNDIAEWEKRGKIIKSRLYNTALPKNYDSEGDPIWDDQYEDNPDYNTFNENVAAQDMMESHEKGLIYYVVTVHFADNSSAISKVYTMYGF